MIKLIISILIGLALTFFTYKVFLSGNAPIDLPWSDKPSSPSDAIEGARDAVEQSQDLQNQLNQRVQDQLSQ